MSAPAVVTLIAHFAIASGNSEQFRSNCQDMVMPRDLFGGLSPRVFITEFGFRS